MSTEYTVKCLTCGEVCDHWFGRYYHEVQALVDHWPEIKPVYLLCNVGQGALLWFLSLDFECGRQDGDQDILGFLMEHEPGSGHEVVVWDEYGRKVDREE